MLRRLLLLVALGLVAAAGYTAYEWRQVEVFHDDGGLGVFDRDWGTDRPMYVAVSSDRKGFTGSAVVHEAEPVVVTNTADAEVTALLCTIDPSSGIGSVGAVDQPYIEEECSALEPIDDQEIPLNVWPDRKQVVLRLELHRPGKVVVESVDLTYSYGWRTGTQRVGGTVRVSTQ